MNHGTSRKNAHRAHVLQRQAADIGLIIEIQTILEDFDWWEKHIHEKTVAAQRERNGS